MELLTTGAIVLAAAAGGFAVGLIYFLALARSTEALAGGGHPMAIAGFTLLRLGGMAVFLFLVARQLGGLPLLGGLAGVLVARVIVTRRVKGAG